MQVRIQSLFFNFSITANGGKNIFWSILREGSKTPLFSGNSLQTVNGVSTVGNVSTMLNHFITEQDFLTKKVRIFFYISCSVRSNRRWK
jgi:hypothetical protein